MTARSTTRWTALWMLAFAIGVAPQVAEADRTVAVLFTGFGATPGNAGMDGLEASLASTFGGISDQPFSSQVFAYTDLQGAFDFIDSFADLGCLILVGHSFGANSTIELVTDFLSPSGVGVDLLIQLDSVGVGDEVLPPGVLQGYNYYQISTSLFEPQGETFVAGSMNYKVEDLYGVTDSDITHTTIDCAFFAYSESAYTALFGSQPDLYARIADHLFVACAVAAPAIGPLGIAIFASLALAIGRRAASRQRP